MGTPLPLPIIYATEHHCSAHESSAHNIVILPLTQGFFAVLDEADLEIIRHYKWFAHRVRQSHVYAASSGGKMHRILMNPPPGMVVDHINGSTLDNRRCNLRVCTARQNQCNRVRRRDARNKYKGVFYNHGWCAQITVDRRVRYLGRYPSAEEAARAYDRSARHHFGEFARTNFQEETCIALAS